MPELLCAFEKIEGRMFVPTKVMFRLMMTTFVRTSKLTETPWSEIDLENESWVIDWQRMKMAKKKLNPRKVDRHVFLPRQGWELLRELHATQQVWDTLSGDASGWCWVPAPYLPAPSSASGAASFSA